MAFPKLLAAHLSAYLLKNWALGRSKFPLVLVIEPTERCNLACLGCGRIREYKDFLDKTIDAETCLKVSTK